MLSRLQCGELLARATTPAHLAAITRALGFVGEPDPLDRRTRRELGIADECRRAWIQRRPGKTGGTLRALLVEIHNERPLREHLTRVAQRLTARGSVLLWFICGFVRDARQVALAVIDVSSQRPRVRALVAESGRVTESDADTLAALAACAAGPDDAVYVRWLEVLGREAVTRRFYHAVAHHVELLADAAVGPATGAVRHGVALVYVTRLLFLAFLESKGWLDGNRSFLTERFAACMRRGGQFHDRVVRPLFFGTLNTRPSHRAPAARALGTIPFLNGGLFARSRVEKNARLRFPDAAIGAFMDDVLTRYRFTVREQHTDWSEAAIDPEMLGKAFESLMGASHRRGSGSYYTPHVLVTHVCDAALQQALTGSGDAHTIVAALRGDALAPVAAATLRARLAALRLLDPACGSGAFLVHALERIATLHTTLGDMRSTDQLRRSVLSSAIFGVDVNPMAVWLCELRLWLSCVIESDEPDVERVLPLPNLDRNIRVGDALLGDGFDGSGVAQHHAGPLVRLRLRYTRATGRRKDALARTLDRETRRHAAARARSELAALNHRRHALITASRGRDLFGGRRGSLPAEREQLTVDRGRARELRRRLRALDDAAALPFSFPTHFADVVDRGGFDIVLGNPPWVRPHNIDAAMRETLRQRYQVLRDAAWRHGAQVAGARSGFGGQADLAAAFVERGLGLVREGGTLALLLPVKLWKALAGAGVRRYLLEKATLRIVEDWSDAPAVFDAAVYPSLVVAERRTTTPNAMELTVHRRDFAVRWQSALTSLPFDNTSGSPWMLLPPEARTGFERLIAAGVPLHSSGIGRITLGVKTGYNAAFLTAAGDDCVEPSLMRPLLRGEDVVAWRCGPLPKRIIWTHGRNGQPVEKLPPLAQMHFNAHRFALEQRSDVRGAKWWSLFRTEAARHDLPRVVWADLARVPRAGVLRAGDNTVPLNTCYVVRCRDDTDAFTLAALFNSPLAAAWLGALAEPARGGFRRLFAWTTALFPLPDDWARARDVLGSLGARAVQGHSVAATELLEAACQAYRIRPASVAALCDWTCV